jgi:hypothetical protein
MSMSPKKRNPFRLREFRGVEPEYVEKLAAAGIKNAEQMLAAGQTAEKRAALAQDTGIPKEAILELVRLSDLARLPGVKGIRARLYYDAGVDCVEKMAAWEAEALLALTAEYVERTGFDGIAPLPKEVSSTIANAKRLPRIVEY